jgi:hypothetical protein
LLSATVCNPFNLRNLRIIIFSTFKEILSNTTDNHLADQPIYPEHTLRAHLANA